MDTLTKILYPLEYAVAWIMVHVHSLLTAIGMPSASGWTWALSIVGLVVVIRIILIPLFVKQIKASRGLQLIQPEMQKIQKKYKDKKDPESRQAMTQETMALYKDSGTNPLASCLPILLQAPIFFALFRVLNQYVRNSEAIGPLTSDLARQADNSEIFGASLSSTFMSSDGSLSVKIITVILIVAMSATTFTTQRQLMMKNMPASALDNPFAKQQKMLMYVLPLVFAVSGVNFPIGVLLYWLTTNAWSMGQQFYVIRRMPAPGSLAEQALLERKRRKGKVPASQDTVEGTVADSESEASLGQRQQPKRQNRGKRPAGPTPVAPPQGPAKQGSPKQGSPKQGLAKQGSPKQGSAKRGSVTQGSAMQTSTKQGSAKQGPAKQGPSKGSAKQAGVTRSGSPHAGPAAPPQS